VGSIVFGFDLDVVGSWAKGSAADTLPVGAPDVLQAEILWTGTATARVGWAFDRLLFYGKGGAAFVVHRDTITNTTVNAGLPATGSATTATWTIGGGVDWAVTEHWIARLDYEYINAPTKQFQLSPPVNTQVSVKLNELRVGMAYKF